MIRPDLADDHARLVAVAAQLRDDRLKGDPAQVEAGKMTAEQAHDRARIITAISAQWADFVAARPLAPQSDRWHTSKGRDGASEDEMRETLVAIAKGAAARANGEAAIDLARAVEALAWWQQPVDPSRPLISRLTRMHGDADAERVWAAEREAA